MLNNCQYSSRKLTGRCRARRVISLACLLVSVIAFSWPPTIAAAIAQPVTLDYQVKAAMLYKFLSYTDWPEARFPTPQSPYRLWVLGTDNLLEELRGIVAGRIVNGHPIEVFAATTPDDIVDAHLVFVGRGFEKSLPNLSLLAEKQSYLIVTENEQGLKPGSIINLRLVDGRVGFDVSLKNAQSCNLKLSARLLSVASSVEEGSR